MTMWPIETIDQLQFRWSQPKPRSTTVGVIKKKPSRLIKNYKLCYSDAASKQRYTIYVASVSFVWDFSNNFVRQLIKSGFKTIFEHILWYSQMCDCFICFEWIWKIHSHCQEATSGWRKLHFYQIYQFRQVFIRLTQLSWFSGIGICVDWRQCMLCEHHLYKQPSRETFFTLNWFSLYLIQLKWTTKESQ